MYAIMFIIKFNNIGPLSELATALIAGLSSISYFRHSYKIDSSFNIDNLRFSRLKVMFINNAKKSKCLVEFDGLIPTKHDIKFYKNFGRKRIRTIEPHIIRYDKGDSNYNESYVKYFRKFTSLDPQSCLDSIVIPISDIIKICHVDNEWYKSMVNNVIYNQKIQFIALFKDYRRKAIINLITINPKINKVQRNTYNYMISKIFSRKDLQSIILKQNREIDKNNQVTRAINMMHMFL
ncbi:hypothetical protein [Acetilactobacillus jinshanensis]|uniref:Uncharacterized protein n=1 Tax=Acetilactobacillus jinshanensis TaxID=1720083 RepID=A0A4P6ZJT0_9LACO|nr:hypothetical protein [Acetilactobacillus jinshanensis]QBP17672.1 hypothetical protein ELX58_00400 [Acetilactobacillus jinshanensis]URL61784.1 hypothetical protein HGK75_07550 [uncultured bacterium]